MSPSREFISQRRKHRVGRPRRGAITLWTILTAPALVVLLCMVVEITHLWHARVEVENALEAAALAAVQSWGEGTLTPTVTHRNVGVAFAAANTVNGDPVTITNNYLAAAGGNENASCSGNLVFGSVSASGSQWVFDAGTPPTCGGAGTDHFAVRAQATVEVPSLCAGFCGIPASPFNVTTSTTAVYECGGANSPRLIRVLDSNYTCP